MNRILGVTWERNGNFDDGHDVDEGGSHVMDKPPSSLSRCQFPYNSDLNSNEILITDLQSDHQEFNKNTSCNTNKREQVFTPNSPTSTFATSLHQKDLSYDDLSKNIDANLAEIDMETFRSEDINSILALPAIYSGHFDSVNHGEQCASVSGSLLNGLEIETSVSNRVSEDEISICKDEPLFSPQREPPCHERTISVDGLDNSSSYDQDLVLTCKANKNNYTIVFEGSETQFSEDSEGHHGLRSSQVVSSASEDVINNENSYTSSSMIQSDLVFTTWSNLKRAHLGKKPRRCLYDISLKSKSLPNLSYQSAFLNDKVLHWAKTRGNKASHSHELEAFPPSNLQIIRKCGYPYTLSLVKLFMKYKVSSRSSVFSSEHSSSTNSSVTHSLNNINHSSSSKIELKDYNESEADLANRNYNIKNQIGLENLNTQQKRQLYVDNIKVLDWHPVLNVNESNNNATSVKSGNKLHISKDGTTTASPSGECDNSQYFEDSLMEAPILQVKNFNTTPIKEEEETDISSGDEVMKTSMSSDCNNCSSASIDAAIIKNNSLDIVSNTTRQDMEHNLERIINVFPPCKANSLTDVAADSRDNQSQATQTKQFNSKNIDHMCTDAPKVKQIAVERCIRHSTGSREASPNSSGYISSRHSSAERLQPSSVGSAEIVSSAATNMKNVLLTTTRNCSTQVPVHVRDCCMQTSTFLASQANAGFLITNSLKGEEISQHECNVESAVGHTDNCPMNKPIPQKDKCIYVCFPNYSLPDLSFLKSVTSDNSTSVFLSPTKLKTCSKLLQTSFSKPKSSEELDSKRLSNIKDWESLSVLLPDDMKHLLTEMKMKDAKADASSDPHIPKGFHSTKTDLPGSFEADKKKHPLTALRQCSFNLRNRNVPYFENFQSPVSSWKGFYHEGVRAKYSHCICQQCQALSAPFIQSKESIRASTSDDNVGKGTYKLPSECPDFKSKNYPSPSLQLERSHSCSRNTAHKPGYAPEELKCTTGTKHKVSSAHLIDKSPRDVSTANSKHAAFKISHKCMTAVNDGIGNKNVKIDQYYDEPNLGRQKQTIVPDNQQTKRLTKCDHVDSDDFFDMEKAPQEFLVSPVQNASPYPISTDSYQMQNSSNNGNTLFHESLKRKTGLVENLQKATVLILEDHTKTFKREITCCTSYSVGQKILTFLCPAVHTILSDGLLPSVQGFFGPLPNSPWKVTEASVQLEDSKKEVQELLKHVNSEKLLTDSTYRFNAFIMGLLNLGSLEWWLGHLMSSQSLVSHHYHPTALLSLLSLPASSHLKQELTELVSPLTTLPFDLDLAFETRLVTAKINDKCSNNCCSPNKNEVSGEVTPNRIQNFNFCNSHKCHKTEPKDLRLNQEHREDLPLWPGVTINPFPNAHLVKDSNPLNLSPRKIIHSKQDPLKYECIQKAYPGIKEKGSRKHIADMSLCSSTDSGCSSQVCQSHDISSAATDSGESESQASAKQDGQQFRKLQQKWEKITLGIEKPKSICVPPAQGMQNVSKKSPVEIHVKKTSRCQVRVTSGDDSMKNPKTTKRAVSQPPSNKQHSRVEVERKLQTPDVIASSKVASDRKNRSHIPTLKSTKNMQPRSKIPVQKSGLRTQSANRDLRNLQ